MTRAFLLQRLPAYCFFPTLLISAVLTQQTEPTLLLLGRMASATGVMLAAVLVLEALSVSVPSLLAVTAVVALRALRPAWGPGVGGAYQLAVLTLFALAGAIVATRYARVLERELYWLCIVSLPLMVLQLVGAGSWTQVLRTDLNSPINVVQVPTLFRWPDQVLINPLQVRPAGWFASNNTFSVVLVFAAAAIISRGHQARLRARDVILVGTVVVSMAKIAFLGIVSLLVWRLLRGNADERRHSARLGATLAVLLIGYALLFPGAFEYNLAPRQILLNIRYRVTDFAAAVPLKATRDWAAHQPESIVSGVSRLQTLESPGAAAESTSQSAYADMVQALPVLFLAMLVLTPAYRRGCRTLRRARPDLARQSVALLIAVLLVPIITSYVLSAIFAVMFGMAILPLLVADGGRWAAMVEEESVPGAA